MEMRALFIQSNLDDAHQARIVRLFAAAGWEVRRCGFFRANYYRSTHDAEVTPLGHLAHGSAVSRLPALASSIRRLRETAKGADVLYCFGPDMHFLATVARPTRSTLMLREIADIPRLLSGRGVRAFLARSLEHWSTRNLDALVVTSEPFVTEYLSAETASRVPPWFLLENKVLATEAGARPSERSQFHWPLRIGYFGLIRCRRSLELLQALVDRHPDRFEVIIRGHNLTDYSLEFSDSCARRIRYLGPYNNPGDLSSIYASCDIVWSCYPFDPSNMNARLAQTNRYYEACYFKKPQICQAGTQDATKVESHNIGIAIDMNVPDACIERLTQIDEVAMSTMASNLEQMPETLFCYSDDVAPIVDFCAQRRAAILRT